MLRFRPLDGESISKQDLLQRQSGGRLVSFRPLDGKSISKLSVAEKLANDASVSVP